MNLKGNILISTTDFGGVYLLQDVVSVSLPVNERMMIKKNHFEPYNLTGNEKRICIVTGIHGDELEGQYVCYELIRKLSENRHLLSGIVDIYPSMNPLGMDSIKREMPIFELDMNMIFPGSETGAVAEHIAAAIMNDIKGADICIDIHASNIFLREIPQVRISEETAPKLLPYAKMLNVDFIWVHSSVTVMEATLSHSLNKEGTPTLVAEMNKENIVTLKSPYRDDFQINGYRFGKGEKTCCIVGAMRGNEVQQLYVCSQIIRALSNIEKKGDLVYGKQIMVIPSLNPFSMNIQRRFWSVDNTDLNRMFPGDAHGKTTQRIAAGIFDFIKEYQYGIQFTSFYISGDFIPHVRMMDTEHKNIGLANLFGLPYILLRKPKPFDTATLNFNWQNCDTSAFSVYTNETEHIDEESANIAVSAVLRFLSRMGVIKYQSHGGYMATTLEEEHLMSVHAKSGGIYRRIKQPGDEVEQGDVMAEILDPFEGTVKEEIKSPANGIVFFAHKSPLVLENSVVYKIIKRLHI